MLKLKTMSGLDSRHIGIRVRMGCCLVSDKTCKLSYRSLSAVMIASSIRRTDTQDRFTPGLLHQDATAAQKIREQYLRFLKPCSWIGYARQASAAYQEFSGHSVQESVHKNFNRLTNLFAIRSFASSMISSWMTSTGAAAASLISGSKQVTPIAMHRNGCCEHPECGPGY